VRCQALTKGGGRCKLDATNGSYCWSHAPENAEARKRRGRRGGKARGAGELAEIKRSIRDVIEGVRGGALERSVGAVVFQGYNCLLKAVETERRIKETDELEARLEALEAAQEEPTTGGGRRWHV
jgi:hypothetical protein